MKDVLNEWRRKLRAAFEKTGRFFARARVKFGRVLNPNPGPEIRKTAFYFGRFVGVMLKAVLTLMVIVIGAGIVAAVYGATYVANDIDAGTPVLLEDFPPNLSTVFYAKDPLTGEFIPVETISGKDNRLIAAYSEVPEYLKKAIVAIEDKRFWEHNGVDWKRTVSAFGNMFLQMRGNFGGSTITQQLLKNITGNDAQTVERKFQEIFSALEFETRYTKEQILERYMNEIYLGNGCDGVKTAAATYFGKELDELTLLECACLSGITNNPYLYDPFTNPENNRRRTDIILGEMLDQEMISQDEYDRAMSQRLRFVSKTVVDEGKIRDWYIDEVIDDVTQDIMELYGWESRTMATQMVYSGGLSIYIVQDLSIQEKMDSIWYDDSKWPTVRDEELPQSTMVIMDSQTGDILAMTGSRTPKTSNLLFNMATDTYRQPGSSFKPLAVYGPAFELGLITPYTTMLDAPVGLNEDGGAWPRNSPERYEGRMTILDAVTNSKNAVSIRVLRDLSLETSRDFATNKFHLSKIIHQTNDAGNIDGESSMAFGALTTGVSVKEMAAAYGVFPSGGIYSAPRTYSQVLDRNGDVLINNTPDRSVSLSAKAAFYMNQTLRSAVLSGTGGRANFNSDMFIAGKTGTTSAQNDRWFCGYTPYYTAACWFGFEMPRPLRPTSSSENPALNLWTQVMRLVHEDLDSIDIERPQGLVTRSYCIDSGMAPSALCQLDPRGSRVATGTFFPEDVPSGTCTMHASAHICGISGHLARPDCPAATLQQIALLNDPDRLMPAAGVVIWDEGVTLRQYGSQPYYTDETHFYPLPYLDSKHDAVSPIHGGAYNSFCEVVHEAAPPPTENPFEPNTESPPIPEYPTLPPPSPTFSLPYDPFFVP